MRSSPPCTTAPEADATGRYRSHFQIQSNPQTYHPMSCLVLNNPRTRFDIPGSKPMFDQIVEDMLASGGRLGPSAQWNWNLGEKDADHGGYSDELYEKNYSHLQKMLDPWVGVTGMRLVEESVIGKYEGFLRQIDHLGLLPEDVLASARANEWMETDFGSILDVNLITIFSGIKPSASFSVCEVGGGYGRLAEVFLQLCPRVHYVMIDAVPGSLMYAYLYLKSQFPSLRIGSYYAGDAYSKDYNCYILPAWHDKMLPLRSFDICTNIESMQEMVQGQVDHYLRLFDKLIVPGGLIYLSNARDYVFKGTWEIPAHWETLYLSNTPRSWTPDHPTHVLRHGSGDHALARGALEGAFTRQAESLRNEQRLEEERQHLENLGNGLESACVDTRPADSQVSPGPVGRWQRLKRRARKNLMKILGG